jgi:hypothetical protein
VTRAEIRKRRLIWSKTAPMYAPDYVAWHHGRYVPAGRYLDHPDHYIVWDRVTGRELQRDELMALSDAALMGERFGLN